MDADLRNPYLFSENQAGEYTYNVDEYGVKSASGSLKLTDEKVRDNAAQAAAGGEMRRGNDSEWGADDGGHLIGARFGGAVGEENLTAQNRNLNRSAYKRMENQWEAHLEAGDKVYVHIEADDPLRPEAYMGYVIYENPTGERDWDAFHMVNESKSEILQWGAEADALEAELYLGDASELDANDYLGSAAVETNEYLGTAGQAEAAQGEELSADSGMSL